MFPTRFEYNFPSVNLPSYREVRTELYIYDGDSILIVNLTKVGYVILIVAKVLAWFSWVLTLLFGYASTFLVNLIASCLWVGLKLMGKLGKVGFNQLFIVLKLTFGSGGYFWRAISTMVRFTWVIILSIFYGLGVIK